MKLESITLRGPNEWDKHTGYRGEIIFEGPQGKVQINTDEALSQRILQVCAAEIVEASKAVALAITAQIIEQTSVEIPAITQTGGE